MDSNLQRSAAAVAERKEMSCGGGDDDREEGVAGEEGKEWENERRRAHLSVAGEEGPLV